MADERGSEYSPTFVYRRKKSPPGSTTTVRPPLATDLHIVFSEGGVSVTNKGGAEKSDRANTGGDTVNLTFPRSKKIHAGEPVTEPATPAGGDQPEAPAPAEGTSCTPTFRHGKPDFPPIKEWWWTHTRRKGEGWENYEGTHHTGNPTGWETE